MKSVERTRISKPLRPPEDIFGSPSAKKIGGALIELEAKAPHSRYARTGKNAEGQHVIKSASRPSLFQKVADRLRGRDRSEPLREALRGKMPDRDFIIGSLKPAAAHYGIDSAAYKEIAKAEQHERNVMILGNEITQLMSQGTFDRAKVMDKVLAFDAEWQAAQPGKALYLDIKKKVEESAAAQQEPASNTAAQRAAKYATNDIPAFQPRPRADVQQARARYAVADIPAFHARPAPAGETGQNEPADPNRFAEAPTQVPDFVTPRRFLEGSPDQMFDGHNLAQVDAELDALMMSPRTGIRPPGELVHTGHLA